MLFRSMPERTFIRRNARRIILASPFPPLSGDARIIRLAFRRMNVLSGMRQSMRLIGNRKAPKHAERSICAKAGSPVGRESYGDGTLIVIGRKYNGVLRPVKEQPSKEGQSMPHDAGIQGR